LNSGGGSLSYSIADDAGWLTVMPNSGTAPQNHAVSVDASGLAAGIYTGTIIISDPYALNNPLRIPVSLTVYTAIPVPVSVSLTGPAKAGAGFISEAFTLISLDQFGNVVPVIDDTSFSLTSESDGIHSFHPAPDEKFRTSEITISAGTSSATFYYKDTVPSPERLVTATCISQGSDLGSAVSWLNVWPVVGQIAYSVFGAGGRGLTMMQPDGTGKTAILSGPTGQYFDSDWSPDGSQIVFSATGVSGGQQSAEIFIMNADGSWTRRLTDNLLGEMSPRWSPDGTQIVFARSMTDPGYRGSEDASCEIFVMNADGSNERRLTNNGTNDGLPAWSADGLKIVFASTRLGNPRIFIMNADGSGPEVLSGTVHWDFGPDWSPNGDRLAITRANGYAHIYTVDFDGTDPLQLCFDPLVGSFPRFSPDGGRLVFMGSLVSAPWEIYRVSADWPDPVALTNSGSSEYLSYPSWGGGKILVDSERGASRAIYVMNPDGSGLTRLTGGTPMDMNADWSYDGTKIVFERYDGTNRNIWTMNANGTSQTNLTNSAAGIINAAPCWSPDGTKIAFSSNRAGDSEIYTMNADGTGLVRLTNAPNTDADPAWSPYGTKIAFWSNRDAVLGEIYVMNADGSNVVRLTNNTVADGSARWSPDGTKIAFFSERDGNPEIYVMNADGSLPTRLTIAPGSDGSPCWSPDGREIAFVRSDIGDPSLFNLYIMNADGTQARRVGDLNGRTMSPSWRTKRNRTPHLY
jgi:Tol biopolymer transport system component